MEINHPSHYNQGNIECIDAMISAFGINSVIEFCHLNAFKYTWRSRDKHKGNSIDDINKAIWYLNKEKDLITSNKLCKTVDTDDFEQYINRL